MKYRKYKNYCESSMFKTETLLRTIEDLSKWRDILCSQIKRFSILRLNSLYHNL